MYLVRSILECSCASSKAIQEHNHLWFLVGLNDSYAHIRGQILLIDPLPAINKVFYVVLQEERQLSISINPPSHETVAMLARTNSQSQQQYRFGKQNVQRPFQQNVQQSFCKERHLFTHCGFLGHTVDKCYKLHGYPLGF